MAAISLYAAHSTDGITSGNRPELSSSPTLVSIPKGKHHYPNYCELLVLPLNLMSDIDPFCDKCGRDLYVWELDKSTIVDLFNARYEGEPVESTVAERK